MATIAVFQFLVGKMHQILYLRLLIKNIRAGPILTLNAQKAWLFCYPFFIQRSLQFHIHSKNVLRSLEHTSFNLTLFSFFWICFSYFLEHIFSILQLLLTATYRMDQEHMPNATQTICIKVLAAKSVVNTTRTKKQCRQRCISVTLKDAGLLSYHFVWRLDQVNSFFNYQQIPSSHFKNNLY